MRADGNRLPSSICVCEDDDHRYGSMFLSICCMLLSNTLRPRAVRRRVPASFSNYPLDEERTALMARRVSRPSTAGSQLSYYTAGAPPRSRPQSSVRVAAMARGGLLAGSSSTLPRVQPSRPVSAVSYISMRSTHSGEEWCHASMRVFASANIYDNSLDTGSVHLHVNPCLGARALLPKLRGPCI